MGPESHVNNPSGLPESCTVASLLGSSSLNMVGVSGGSRASSVSEYRGSLRRELPPYAARSSCYQSERVIRIQ
eukprot:2910334-Pyramimonas_sp.AAC.1